MSAQKKVVNLRDFSEEIGIFRDAQIEALKKAAIAGVSRSIPDLVKGSPVDTGLYAASWDFTPTETSVLLGNYAPYAGIIEYGARPFTPPIGPLLAWAKRVLQDPSQPPEYSDRVWALAKGVQNKIAAEGMKPRAVMEQMIPTILANIKAEYEAMR